MSDKYRDFVEQRVTPLGEGPSGGALGPPVPGAIGSAGEPPLSAVERKTYNLVKAADVRLEAVEIELRKSRSLVADLEAEVKLKAEEVQRRDSSCEIDRLSRAVEENINLDRLALEQRNQEAAAEVDALRRQLESLGQHMKDHEFSQARSREIEAALEASEATRTELEQRLQVAVEENAAIQTELQATNEGLASLQELHAQAGYTPEVPAPLAPAPPAPAAAAADAAVKRDVDLATFQEEKEALLEELSVLRETNDILKQREKLITQQAEMQLGQYREAIQAMQQEMEGTNTRLLELQEHVLRMHEAQQGPGGTPEVSERLAQAEQALNALEKALELVSGEKAELYTCLQEMNESRLQISAAYQASEEERKRVEGELTALKAASAGQGHETPVPAAFFTDAAPGASEEATAFKLEIQRLNAKWPKRML